MKKIVIGQSGGPTAVINASIAGAYKKAKELGVNTVYGMINGIEGFLNEDFVILDDYLNNEENYELLKRTPGAFLGSCRYKLPKIEDASDVYERIFNILDKYEIDAFFYAGGNDSMDTIKMLSDYAKMNNKPQKFVGIPKTIDNDLPIIDHCPGYGSACKYIATSIKEIIRDNSSFNKSRLTVCIVEIMGRHAGWLTAAASLAKGEDSEGVDAIYLPEEAFDINEFLDRIEKLRKKKSSIVIAVSEGICTKDGKFVCELGSEDRSVDAFGHKQLSGCASTLANIVADKTGLKTRAIELSTLQRSASHISSLVDVSEAEKLGMTSVNAAYNNESGVMSIIDDKGNTSTYDIHKIANVEKKVPSSMYNKKTKQMTKKFIDYALPLIQGELNPIYKNGLPVHLIR